MSCPCSAARSRSRRANVSLYHFTSEPPRVYRKLTYRPGAAWCSVLRPRASIARGSGRRLNTGTTQRKLAHTAHRHPLGNDSGAHRVGALVMRSRRDQCSLRKPREPRCLCGDPSQSGCRRNGRGELFRVDARRLGDITRPACAVHVEEEGSIGKGVVDGRVPCRA